MRYIPYNGPGVLPDWLLEPPSRPRICVTWGATTEALTGTGFVDQVRQAVEAGASLDAEVVVAVSRQLAERLDGLPDNVRMAVSLPLHLLLPSCAAVVHHGGAGTTLTAAACGVPQLTVTRRPEPALNGARVAAAGAGHHLVADEVPSGPDGLHVLRTELVRLIETSAYREAADRLRAEMAGQPAPPEIVARLEKLS
jgi:glycosyltransferase